jgi:hypothetical protein
MSASISLTSDSSNFITVIKRTCGRLRTRRPQECEPLLFPKVSEASAPGEGAADAAGASETTTRTAEPGGKFLTRTAHVPALDGAKNPRQSVASEESRVNGTMIAVPSSCSARRRTGTRRPDTRRSRGPTQRDSAHRGWVGRSRPQAQWERMCGGEPRRADRHAPLTERGRGRHRAQRAGGTREYQEQHARHASNAEPMHSSDTIPALN